MTTEQNKKDHEDCECELCTECPRCERTECEGNCEELEAQDRFEHERAHSAAVLG